jgi:4-amino-4-deoxy-L-arabinose transferase-like glycosyltransferase
LWWPLPTLTTGARTATLSAALAAGLIASAVLYTYQLDRVPAFLTLDEAHFSVHAESLARTGRNLNGQLLPPLISLEDPEGEQFTLPWGTTYYLPFGMYLIAGALQILPLTEATVRTPSALLGGAINVALIFAVALALFRNRPAAVASAAVLALTPANVILSRQALDSVCQPPFILGALWCLATYVRKPDPRLALAAGVILGCGVYAYITSVIFMPFYLALFWFIGWRAGVLDRRAIALSIAGFVAALLPMALWLLAHPDAARSLQMQYNRADPGSATLMQALSGGGLGAALADTIRIYWSYFDPGFLFVQGGNARSLSTGETGVFLAPVAVLALIGLYDLRRHRLVQLLLIIGLFASPIPAVIKGAPYAIQRASGLLIFVCLFAGAGLAALAASRRGIARAGAVVLVILAAYEFTGFYRDYHSRYRIGSGRAYDPTAFRVVAEIVINADAERAAAEIYLPNNFYDAGAKWRFYTLKHERAPLWHRTKYFADPSALDAAPADAIAVVPQAGEQVALPQGWTTIGVARDLAGEPTAAVVRRR